MCSLSNEHMEKQIEYIHALAELHMHQFFILLIQ
jgi:hypothetical protein